MAVQRAYSTGAARFWDRKRVDTMSDLSPSEQEELLTSLGAFPG
jgi:hypothetical protein